MSYTKQQFVDAALMEVIPHAVASMQPEQKEQAMRTLDAMIAEWYRVGIRLGYPLPTNPEDSKLSDRTNVPDGDNATVINCLAVRLCSRFGKTASKELTGTAKAGYDVMTIRAVQPLPIQLQNGMPAGAGNLRARWARETFIPLPEDQVIAPPAPNENFGSGS